MNKKNKELDLFIKTKRELSEILDYLSKNKSYTAKLGPIKIKYEVNKVDDKGQLEMFTILRRKEK